MTLNPWRRQEPLDHAELARLLPAPGDPALPQDRRLLLEEHLMREIRQEQPTPDASTPPRRSRKRLVYYAVPGALLALAGGALAATTLLGSSPASEPNSVRCFIAADLTAHYNNVSMAEPAEGPPPGDISATVSAAVGACAGLWEAGLMPPGSMASPTARPGEPLVIPSGTPGQGRVPLLTACVLESGEAAVFPGDGRNLCQNLGLAQLTDRP
ncbi:hypothetical protein [Streptomyces sp. NPDC091371]|uniref:hypothetical protein n=1 Tax=Streptomyces sp. NPDC091371 TaxID=3155303 RepID=UPI0034161558